MKIECEVNVPEVDADREVVLIERVTGSGDRALCVTTRKKWEPPAWLRPGWIWKRSDGNWFWSWSYPNVKFSEWDSPSAVCIDQAGVVKPYEFNPPECDNYAISLRKINGPDPKRPANEEPISDLAEEMLRRANLRYKVIQYCYGRATVSDSDTGKETATYPMLDAESHAKGLNTGSILPTSFVWYPNEWSYPKDTQCST